jgi:hypothetical protein
LNTGAQLTCAHDFGAIQFTGSGERVIGIVTDRDICVAAYTQGRALRANPV